MQKFKQAVEVPPLVDAETRLMYLVTKHLLAFPDHKDDSVFLGLTDPEGHVDKTHGSSTAPPAYF